MIKYKYAGKLALSSFYVFWVELVLAAVSHYSTHVYEALPIQSPFHHPLKMKEDNDKTKKNCIITVNIKLQSVEQDKERKIVSCQREWMI